MKKDSITVLFVALVIFSTARLIEPLVRQSATYDEPYKIGASYVMAKEGYFKYDPTNPPLYKYCFSVPLLFLHPDIPRPDQRQELPSSPYFKNEFAFGYRFLFNNTVPAWKLLVSTRCISLIFYLLGGTVLFGYVRKKVSSLSGLLAATLYFLCPNLAASAVLATNDIFAAVCALFFFISLLELYEQPNRLMAAVTGIVLGAAISAKFSLFILVVFYGVGATLLVIRKKRTLKETLLLSLIVLGLSLFVIELNYQFMSPAAIAAMIHQIYAMVSRGAAAYVMGNYSREGFIYFYPLAFLLKTPVPVMALIVIAVYLFFAHHKYSDDRALILAVCIAIFFVAVLTVHLDLGFRYVLPVYPLLYLFTAIILRDKQRFLRIAVTIVALLLVCSNIAVYPHFQSYCNLLIGKNQNAYKYFVDSSVDWGQDLGELASYLKSDNNPEVTLAYFGSSNPTSYGIKYQDLCSDGLDQSEDETRFTHINSDNPHKEVLAVSVTCLVGLDYPDHAWFSFLSAYSPVKIIANTIFVYDITVHPEIYKSMAMLYCDTKQLPHLLRCGRRVHVLDPSDSFGALCADISKGGSFDIEPSLFAGANDRELLLRTTIMYVGMLTRQGHNTEALRQLDRLALAHIAGVDYKINNLRGMIYLRAGDSEHAQECFRQSIADNPANASAYFNLGVLCEKKSDIVGAVEMYRQALVANPTYVPARIKLEQWYNRHASVNR
ncbi:MAG: tetratricopeptide repeat protein [Endomicrobiales bacterium]